MYVGTFGEGKSNRLLFPAVLLTVYIVALAIATVYEMLTYVISLTENVFRWGAGAYILFLGIYCFLQKEVKP